jgi:hypothetical protein
MEEIERKTSGFFDKLAELSQFSIAFKIIFSISDFVMGIFLTAELFNNGHKWWGCMQAIITFSITYAALVFFGFVFPNPIWRYGSGCKNYIWRFLIIPIGIILVLPFFGFLGFHYVLEM